MEEKRDYISDLAEIRAMMERSTKFLSLSGWSGVLAGIYALVGAYIAQNLFGFKPVSISVAGVTDQELTRILILASMVLVLSVVTGIVLSYVRAKKREERIWNMTSQRLLVNIAVPLISGGVLILILISHGLLGLMAPLSLIFYGLALYTAGNYTYREVRFLGLIQLALGLASSYCIELSMILWAIGFGLMHIGYGMFIHLKYER